MIKCIIFDLDGTLIDTLKDLGTTANDILNEYGYSSIDIEQYRYIVGNGIRTLMERSLTRVNGDLSLLDDAYAKFIKNYNENCLKYACLYPGIKELIEELKNKDYLLYVNTNKNHEISIEMINYFLPNVFLGVYGDSKDFPRKPSPYIVNTIIDRHNLKTDEVLYVGDSNVDCITAHNANIKVVGCKYGFRGEEELRANGADYLIDTPLDLLKILNN